MKFGGTSVGDAERLAAAARLVKEYGAERPTVVVVSAMAGVTNQLVSLAQAAARGAVEEKQTVGNTLGGAAKLILQTLVRLALGI